MILQSINKDQVQDRFLNSSRSADDSFRFWNHFCYHKSFGCSACSHTTNEQHLSPTGSKPRSSFWSGLGPVVWSCTRIRLTAFTPARTNRTNLENTAGSILNCPKSCFPAWTVFSPLCPLIKIKQGTSGSNLKDILNWWKGLKHN